MFYNKNEYFKCCHQILKVFHLFGRVMFNYLHFSVKKSKEEGKYRESIQSSTTLGPGTRYGKAAKIQENIISHKAARNRQDSMTKTNTKYK